MYLRSHAVPCLAGSVGMLVVDFDETCSQGDTISILLSAAVEARARVSSNRTRGNSSSTSGSSGQIAKAEAAE